MLFKYWDFDNQKYNYPKHWPNNISYLTFKDLQTDNSGVALSPAVIQKYQTILMSDNLHPEIKTAILNQIKYCKVVKIGNKKAVKVISQPVRNFIYNRLSLNKIISGIMNHLSIDYDTQRVYFVDNDKISQQKKIKAEDYEKFHSLELSDVMELNEWAKKIITDNQDDETIEELLKVKNEEFNSLFGASFKKRYYWQIKKVLDQIQPLKKDINLVIADLQAEGIIPGTALNKGNYNYDSAINYNWRDFSNYDLKTASYVIFDIETTGLNASNSEIIELAGVKIQNNKVVEEFSTLINPECYMDEAITKLTGIKSSDLVNQPTIKTVLPKFLEFCQGSILVAHNAEFDYNFIVEKYRQLIFDGKIQAVIKKIQMPYICTLKLAEFYFMNKLCPKNFKLNTLAKHFKVKLVGHHRALNDVYATKEIFIKILHFIKRITITKFWELNFCHVNKFAKNSKYQNIKIGYRDRQNVFTLNIKKYLALLKKRELMENDKSLADPLNNQVLFNLFNQKYHQYLISTSPICCNQTSYLNHLEKLKLEKNRLETELKRLALRCQKTNQKKVLELIGAEFQTLETKIKMVNIELGKSYDDFLREHFNTILKLGRDGKIDNPYFKSILALNYLLGQHPSVKAYNLETQQKTEFKNRDQFLKSKKAFKNKAEHNYMQSQTISFLTLTAPASQLTQNPIFMHEVLRKFWDNVNKQLKKLGLRPSQDFPRMTVTELTQKGTLHYHNLFKDDLVDLLGVIKGHKAIDYCYENFNGDYEKVAQKNSYIFQNRFKDSNGQFKTEFIKFHKRLDPSKPIEGGKFVIPKIFIIWIEVFKETLSNQKIINLLPVEIIKMHCNLEKTRLISKLPLPTSQDYTFINRWQGLKHFYHQGSYKTTLFKATHKNFMQTIIKYITKYMSKADNNANNNVLKLFNKRVFISSRACKKVEVSYFQCLESEILFHPSLKGMIYKKYVNNFNFVESSLSNPIKKYIVNNYLQEHNKTAIFKTKYYNYQFFIDTFNILVLKIAEKYVLRDYSLNNSKYASYLQQNLYFYKDIN
ncbi:MAG: PolC-type DNA polymerase III [Candidatus Phytoplasma pyri]